MVTSAERAPDRDKEPVGVLGAGSHHTHSMISQMPDLTTTPRLRSGEPAFAMSGLTPDDIDVVELYDWFTITVLLALEDLGFCAKGEGEPFVADGRSGPGGALPGQTSPAEASRSPTRGAFGMFLLVEAVRQLRGEIPASVRSKEPRRAIVDGCGRRALRHVHRGTRDGGSPMSEAAASRTVPDPSEISQPFWDATRERRLVLQRCDACAIRSCGIRGGSAPGV